MDYLDYHYHILIDGKLCDPVKGATMDVVNPANGKVIAKAPRCTAEDVDLAAKAAQKARRGRAPLPGASRAGVSLVCSLQVEKAGP